MLGAILAPFLPAVAQRTTSRPEYQPWFPSVAHQFVWRNWDLLPPERIAAALQTDAFTVLDLASQMMAGAPASHLREDDRLRFQVLRRNWRFVPLQQIALLLQMSVGQINELLSADIYYRAHLGEQPLGLRSVRVTNTSSLVPAARLFRDDPDTFGEEARYAFESEFADFSSQLPHRTASPGAPVISYPYVCPFGDVLNDPDFLRHYPPGLLRGMAEHGVTAIWVHARLRDLVPDPLFEADYAYTPDRIKRLQGLVQYLNNLGLGLYVYLNEPRGCDSAYFARHPDLRGAPGHPGSDLWSLCTSAAPTLDFLRNGTTRLFETVPELEGLVLITASENPTNCYSLSRKPDCSRCSERNPSDVISEVIREIRDGAKVVAPGARIIAWDWSWNIIEDDPQREIIESLPDGISLMVDYERGTPIERAGVRTVADEYSLSVPGPSLRAVMHVGMARARGLETLAKVQIGTTWELGTVPYLPVPDLVAEKLKGMARNGLAGGMFSWTLGGLPSLNWKVALRMMNNPEADADEVLTTMASELYGEAASAVRTAWKSCTDAFRHYPFSIPVVYSGFVQHGPAHRLYVTPTGYPEGVLNSADSLTWTWPYRPEIVAETFTRMGEQWLSAVADLRSAVADAQEELRRGLERDIGVMEAAGLHFEAIGLMIRYYLMRNVGSGATTAYRTNVERQLQNAQRHLRVCRSDSRIGYEAQTGYMYTPLDVREKIAACRYQLDVLQRERERSTWRSKRREKK